jgi:predicted GIY-YIG superfamily endonuclease
MYIFLKALACPKSDMLDSPVILQNALKEHNAGKSPYTEAFKPWKLVVAIKFSDDQKADAFERYLKSGSGHAFAKRHFW